MTIVCSWLVVSPDLFSTGPHLYCTVVYCTMYSTLQIQRRPSGGAPIPGHDSPPGQSVLCNTVPVLHSTVDWPDNVDRLLLFIEGKCFPFYQAHGKILVISIISGFIIELIHCTVHCCQDSALIPSSLWDLVSPLYCVVQYCTCTTQYSGLTRDSLWQGSLCHCCTECTTLYCKIKVY